MKTNLRTQRIQTLFIAICLIFNVISIELTNFNQDNSNINELANYGNTLMYCEENPDCLTGFCDVEDNQCSLCLDNQECDEGFIRYHSYIHSIL